MKRIFFGIFVAATLSGCAALQAAAESGLLTDLAKKAWSACSALFDDEKKAEDDTSAAD